MTKNIATAYVKFIPGPGGKRRPIYVLQDDGDVIYFFDITTKYKNKPKHIKKWYYEIQEYQGTGLRLHSWIDTFRVYSLKNNSTKINYIGRLTDKDTSGLKDFIKKNRNKKK